MRAHGNGLRAWPESVLDINVVEFEVARPDSQRGREVVVGLCFLALRGDDRDLVFRVLGIVSSISEDGKWSTDLGNIDLFGVGAWVYKDHLLVGCGVGERCDSGRDGGEFLPCAYCESAWRCGLATCCES